MKKIILTVAAVCAFGFANAQETKFGVKGGINLSNYSGDSDDYEGKVGFNVGGFAEIKISDKFAIQPELLFSTQGAKFSESGPDFTVTYKENLSYLNIPVMAKYYVADKFSIEAGPQIGFLVAAKGKGEGNFTGTNFSESEDIKSDFNTVDFGVNFGLGFDFTEKVSLGFRYNLGLSNVIKDSSDFKDANSVLSLSIGYKF